MPNKLRFAVIGTGRMGMRRARTIIEHPETELVCVVDNDADKAQTAAKDIGCDYYVDYREAIRRSDLDHVVVSVPNKFHHPVVIDILKCGKHVFCEKPLARNPDEAREMVKVASENGLFLKTSSNLRYFPSVQKAKELLDNSAIGESLFARGQIGNSGWATKGWFSDPEMAGGGTFLDNGAHLLDIMRWFLGEVRECTGYITTKYWPIAPLEDNGMGIFIFNNDKMAFVHSSWTEWADYMYMEIYGKEGYIRIDNRVPNCIKTLAKKDGYQEIFDYSHLPPQSYCMEFNDYVNAIRNQRYPQPSGFDGLRAVQMAYGVYESARLGKRVTVWGDKEEELSRVFSREARE